MKIVFFGTPLFAAEILQDLVENEKQENFSIVGVVTKQDQPRGRDLILSEPAVKKTAKLLLPNIPILQPVKASDPVFLQDLKALQADLFVVVAYGQILKQSVLDLPPKGCINVHASLLPKYRGAAPIQRAVMQGEKESGVTIMQMSLGMDEGDILTQEKVCIPFEMNAGELQEALCQAGKKALLKTIKEIDLNTIRPIVQNGAEATYAPKIELEDTQLNLHKPALELYNLIRGATPIPGAWTYLSVKGVVKKLKISKAVLSEKTGNPGEILEFNKYCFLVACKEGSLSLVELQLEGKKKMSFLEFVNGHKKEDLFFC